MKILLLKLLKFCIVGFSGLIIDFGITYYLKEKIRIQKYIANAIGFTVAASSNYFLNRIWTFHSTNPRIFTEYSTFIIISLIGLGINSLILWVLVSKFKQHFYLSKLIAIIITTFWNFIANLLYTF
ncbi:MAG: GtrA family protein [Bacteroidota bacterium]